MTTLTATAASRAALESVMRREANQLLRIVHGMKRGQRRRDVLTVANEWTVARYGPSFGSCAIALMCLMDIAADTDDRVLWGKIAAFLVDELHREPDCACAFQHFARRSPLSWHVGWARHEAYLIRLAQQGMQQAA